MPSTFDIHATRWNRSDRRQYIVTVEIFDDATYDLILVRRTPSHGGHTTYVDAQATLNPDQPPVKAMERF